MIGCSCRWAMAGFLGLLACGPGEDQPAGDDGNDASTTTTGDPTGGEVGTGGETGEESSTGEPDGPTPARGGIAVDWVEANQGIGVAIGRDGKPVAGADRTAFLLANRIALVRAFWTIPDDWEPREIVAHLVLDYADGTTETLKDRKVVEGPAFIGNLDESFYWGITAEQAIPGMTYRVELYEVGDGGAALPAADPPPRLPANGDSAFVGIEDSYQILKIVIVPFNYNDGASCVTTPDTSEATMEYFRDQMYQMNPVDQLEIELHDPIAWDTPLEAFGELNSFMSAMRFEENALPETYYYGLVDVCSGGLGGAGGQAHGIPNDPTLMEAAYQRVSSGLSLDPDFSSETFVHEVGHSQGRRHVACNGEEGGPDPTYPIPGGDVGEWGFGVIDFGLRHPTVNKDYMTYCHPVWVSTWGWNKIYPVIKALSAWDEGNPDAGPRPADPYGGSLLVGTILPSGREIWQTVPGRLDRPLDPDVRFEFGVAGQAVHSVAAARIEVPDAHGERMFAVPLPAGFDAFSEITRIEGDQRIDIPRTSIRLRHHLRHVTR